MRVLFCLGILSALVVSASQASLVIHDGQPGIVAAAENVLLDSEGRVWQMDTGVWVRHPEMDPPLPVSDILFWDVRYLVSTDSHFWVLQGPYWYDWGYWPTSEVIEENPGALRSAIAPNPSIGECRGAFATQQAGPVSVSLFDASGRMIRQLLSGDLPAGYYAPIWDGRDDSGRDLPSGVYLVRIATPAGEESERIVLAR